jgi:AcrR family transcriptional regulator
VPSEHTGTGDPSHTLELLWRHSGAAAASAPDVGRGRAAGRRGPRQGLTVDAVLVSAIELADADGLAALTMRRLATALGVAPMTLYTYVPGKGELLDLMVDAVYAELPLPDSAGQPWRQRLGRVAEQNRALYADHPWAAEISTARPPLGPGQLAKYEHELAALDGLGLDDVTADAALTYLLGFVQGWARAAADARAPRGAGTGTAGAALDDERWWAANAPLLERVLDPARYPRAVRIGAAAGAAHGAAYSPDHAYHFGLARVLDGLATLLEATPPTAPKRTDRR